MNANNQYKIPLADLIETLRNNGYEFTIEQVLELQSALLSTDLIKISPHELKYILTPIIAGNEEEQQDIYRIIDAYIAEKTQHDQRSRKEVFTQMSRQKALWLKFVSLLLVIIAGVAFYFYTSNIERKSIPASAKAPAVAIDSIAKTSESRTQTKEITTAERQTQLSSIDVQLSASHGALPPRAINFNLELSLALGTIMGIITAYLIFYEKKKMMSLQKQKTTEHFPGGELQEQISIQFPEQDFIIRKTSEFSAIRSNLKRPAPVEQPAIDLERSILKTARNAGFTSLVYNDERKERKYLILTEDSEPESHTAHLLNHLVHFLRTSRLPVQHHSFTTNIGTLKSLAENFSDRHLIIVGDIQLSKDAIKVFNRWSSRSVITPLSLNDWTNKEWQLYEHGFNIVPAEIEAVKLLSKMVSEDQPVRKDQLIKQIRNSYGTSGFDLNAVHELKAYLGTDELFQFVCALSIYPRLRWSLTLALADKLISPDHNTLLKIARIPWINNGTIEHGLRLELLSALQPETELKAREIIIKLLDEARNYTSPLSAAYQELEEQYNINSFFLYAHDPLQYKQYSSSKRTIGHQWNELSDHTFKQHVDSGNSKLMPLDDEKKHISVNDFLLQEEQFETRNVNLSKLALLTVPAILLYIFFWAIRPEAVYPKDRYKAGAKTAIVVYKYSNCKKDLTRLIVDWSGKAKDTSTLNTSRSIDTIFVNNLRYKEQVRLTFLHEDGSDSYFPIVVTDSFYIFSAQCK